MCSRELRGVPLVKWLLPFRSGETGDDVLTTKGFLGVELHRRKRVSDYPYVPLQSVGNLLDVCRVLWTFTAGTSCTSAETLP